jgi:hypothetical protein
VPEPWNFECELSCASRDTPLVDERAARTTSLNEPTALPIMPSHTISQLWKKQRKNERLPDEKATRRTGGDSAKGYDHGKVDR